MKAGVCPSVLSSSASGQPWSRGHVSLMTPVSALRSHHRVTTCTAFLVCMTEQSSGPPHPPPPACPGWRLGEALESRGTQISRQLPAQGAELHALSPVTSASWGPCSSVHAAAQVCDMARDSQQVPLGPARSSGTGSWRSLSFSKVQRRK